MRGNRSFNTVNILFAAVAVTLLASTGIFAQNDAKKIKETVDGTVGIEQGTQQKRDKWEKEKSGLVARYQAAQANVAYLADRKALKEKELAAISESIAEMNRRLVESDRLTATIQDTLNFLMARLDAMVNADLPFLEEERSDRLAYLKKEMVRPDVKLADKLRTLLNALHIEMGYGSTVEVVQQKITVDGDELFVDLLRLGRVSVFWRTPDGKRCGEFDRATRQWIELPGKYNRNIGKAMEMAANIRPVELISLPLGRIEP
jgi:hypothetical protein